MLSDSKMKLPWLLLAFLCMANTSVDVIASSLQPDDDPLLDLSSTLDRSSSLESISKQVARHTLDNEIRKGIIEYHRLVNGTGPQQPWKSDIDPESPTRRQLQQGGFNKLNEILGTLELNIPPQLIQQKLLGFLLTVRINGTCSDIKVNNIVSDYDTGTVVPNVTSLAYKLEVLGAGLKCYIHVDWNTGVLDVADNLKIKLVLDESNFGIAIRLDGAPPDKSVFEGCKTQLEVQNITSSGGFSSNIINELNYLLVDIVRNDAGLISSSICDALTASTNTVDGLLMNLDHILAPYLVNLPPVNPLALQESVETNVTLLDFTNSSLGNIISVLIRNLAGVINANTLNTFVELNVLNGNNTLVIELAKRKNVTTGNRRSVLEDRARKTVAPTPSTISTCLSQVNFTGIPLGRRLSRLVTDNMERHLQAINTNISNIIDLNNLLHVNQITPLSIEIKGLNNFTNVEPLQIIGKQTLRTRLFLANLDIKASVYINVDFNNVTIQEFVDVYFEVSGINILTSYLVGLDAEKVNSLTLGDFLNTQSILGCLLSSLVTAGVSQLDITVNEIGTPAIVGAISTGVDELLNTGLEGTVCAYQDLLRSTIPVISQQNLTVYLNEFIDCYIAREAGNQATCNSTVTGEVMTTTAPSMTTAPSFGSELPLAYRLSGGDGLVKNPSGGSRVAGYLDFRDLLLPPDEARALGGSGQEPYGNVVHMAFSALRSQFYSVDNETGLLGINNFVPANGLQLGGGLFSAAFNTSSIKFINLLLQSVSASIYNLKLGNIDTIVAPASVLQPTTRAHVLENIFHFGTLDRKLNLTTKTDFALSGTNSSLAMNNQLDAIAVADEVDVQADVRVMISTQDFISFPIGDLLNFKCWLALIQNPNTMTISGDEMVDNSFMIRTLLLDILSLSLQFDCLSCTSKLLSPAIDTLERAGAFQVLGDRLGPLLEEVGTSDMVPPMITNMVGFGDKAARFCPHSPLYNTTSNETAPFSLVLPSLSNQSIDTIVYSGILGFEVFAVVVAESHVTNNVSLPDPLSGQARLINNFSEVMGNFSGIDNFTGGIDNLLDWTRLNETAFLPFAGDALDFVRNYLGGNGTGGPGVNSVVKDFLAIDGTFNVSLGNLSFDFQGYEVTLGELQVKGLDSFKIFDILEPIAPQTLQNHIKMDDLSIKVGFSVDNTNTTDPPQPYTISFDLRNVNATIYLFTAIDMVAIEALEIGQLLFINNIVPCVLSAAHDIHVPAITLELGGISQPVIEGLMPNTSEAASSSLQAILSDFQYVFVEAANSIADTSLRPIINEFVANFLANPPVCGSTESFFKETGPGQYVDFRDLLLSPEDARSLGGSGTAPYGDIVSTAYSMLLNFLVANETGQVLNLNSQFIDGFTKSQSNVTGMLLFGGQLFSYILEQKLPIEFMSWLEERIEIGAFDGRIRNINTLLSPLAIFQPTTQPHIVENVINFGPVSGRPFDSTVGALVDVNGDLSGLNMRNFFDIGASFSEINLAVALRMLVLEKDLFLFPVKDVLESSCWLSLIKPQLNGVSEDKDEPGIDSLLMKFASMIVDLNCLNCTSVVLPGLVDTIVAAGASLTLGNRLGPLAEDIAMGLAFAKLVTRFVPLGREAARSCPHSPLFNTTNSSSNETTTNTAFTLPPLSNMSLDTILFSAMISAQAGLVVISETHLQNSGESTDAMRGQNALQVAKGTNLLDWTALGNSSIPFLPSILDFVRNYLGGPYDPQTGLEPGVNGVVSGLINGNGVLDLPVAGFSFEIFGLAIHIRAIRAQGLNFFTQFDILKPIAPQTMQNSISLPRMKLQIELSVESVGSSDLPRDINMTFDAQDVNISVPLFAAIDEDLLGSLEIGSLLHSNNILPCLLSTSYGFRLEQTLLEIGRLEDPIFEGFLPDTAESLSNATRAIFDSYGGMIEEAIPLIFNDTIRVLANSYLASMNKTNCTLYSTNTSSTYVDFREMFGDSNAMVSSPYGDLIPLIKSFVENSFLSDNPETSMPKINDAVIAPFTEGQSGVAGTLLLPGKLYGFKFNQLPGLGLDVGTIGVQFSDARVENLDTVGQPFDVAQPNATGGDLLDNRLTFGTDFNPLRFSIKGTFSFMGPVLSSRDEMDIFGELRTVPIFAVLLARLGARDFLSLPLQYTSDTDCWFSAFAAPALDQIVAGNLTVNPVLALDYLGIVFENMRISASCFNCTTPGLNLTPGLLEIVETTTTKNVLGYRWVDLFLEITKSDFAQVWLLRVFQDSMRKCKLTRNETEAYITFPNPPFPQLSQRSVETGVFTVTVSIQLGLVMLAQTIATLKNVGPFFPDPEPNIPAGTRLVDFTALDTYQLGGLVKGALDGLNSFLGKPSADPITGKTTLGINSLFANPIFPIKDFSFKNNFDIGISGLKVSIKGVTVSDIDTFTKFHIGNITGPTTLQNELGWQRLQLEINMEVDVSNNIQLQRKLQQKSGSFPFTVTIGLENVSASAAAFLALDYELLKTLELGNLLRVSEILPCIQAAVLYMKMTEVKLEVGKITKMSVTGWTEPDTTRAAELLEKAILEKYGKLIASMAPNLMSVAIRPVLNDMLTSYLRNSNFRCNQFEFDPSSDGFIDFRDLFLPPDKSRKLGGTGKEQYGNLIHIISQYSPIAVRYFLLPNFDNLSFPGSLFDQGIRFDIRAFQAEIALRISDLRINNIGSVGTLAYVDPVENEPHVLTNELQFGVGKPLGIALRTYFRFKGLDGVDIVDDFDLNFDINTLGIVLNAFLEVSEEDFVSFPLRDILNLNCWLATIPPPPLDDEGYRVEGSKSTLSLEELNITMKKLNMGVECFNCTSPKLFELADLLASPGVTESLTKNMNKVLGELSKSFGGKFMQDLLDRLLVEAPSKCPHTDNRNPNATSFKTRVVDTRKSQLNISYVAFIIVILVTIFAAVAIAVGLRMAVLKRHKKWIDELPSERVFLIQQKQEKEDHMETELNELTLSMFKSEEIPCVLRYWVPIIVVVNIGFFLSGHLSPGGKAFIDFHLAGETFQINDFYEFSIAQSTLDMWHAGGEELATLILLFSGVWPYTKQLITLALWFLPPSIVSCSRRGQFLLMLDLLAKWSMIDIFVLLITIAGFRMEVNSPDFVFLPKEFYAVDLVIIPLWGLFANMIAQLMSQISSHFIVHYHRRIINKAKEQYKQRHYPQQPMVMNLTLDEPETGTLTVVSEQSTEKKERLCDYNFRRPHKEGEEKIVARRCVNYFLPMGAAMLCVLLAIGCTMPSLQLEAFGVIGILIEIGQKLKKTAIRTESIFSMAKIFVDEAKYLDEFKQYIGLGFLALLFITTLLVVPIVQICTLVFLWMYPLASRRRHNVGIFLEILQAWQYVEVYILGIVIMSWQLGSISKLFLNRYCQSIQGVLVQAAYYGIIKEQDAQCFEMEASVTSGSFLLIPFVICLALINTYVVKAYVQFLREKHEEGERVTEEDKLRAFDRTTWDNRQDALKNVRSPLVLFTDTFRWTLRPQPGTASDAGTVEGSDDGKLAAIDTYVLPETSSEEDNIDVPRNAFSGSEDDVSSHEENAEAASENNDVPLVREASM